MPNNVLVHDLIDVIVYVMDPIYSRYSLSLFNTSAIPVMDKVLSGMISELNGAMK
jgi:hypothetical protein